MPALEVEYLALLWACKELIYYLRGSPSPTRAITDHKPLVGLHHGPMGELSQRMMAVRSELWEFSLLLAWDSGHRNLIADTLGRLPQWHSLHHDYEDPLNGPATMM